MTYQIADALILTFALIGFGFMALHFILESWRSWQRWRRSRELDWL
jgi:hypothetical protein